MGKRILDYFAKFRSKIIHTKIFYQRALGYISLVNSSMILFLLLSSLENYGIDIRIERWFFPILIFGVIVLIIVGYLEDWLGFYRTEQEAVTRRNPQMTEVLDRLERIEKRLAKIKK